MKKGSTSIPTTARHTQSSNFFRPQLIANTNNMDYEAPPVQSIASPFNPSNPSQSSNHKSPYHRHQPDFLRQRRPNSSRRTPSSGRRVRAIPSLTFNTPTGTPLRDSPRGGTPGAPTPNDDTSRGTTPFQAKAIRLRRNTSENSLSSSLQVHTASRNGGVVRPRSNNRRTLNSLWVTAFGFEASMGSDVLTLFESFGDILDHQPGLTNSIDLMFSTKEEAEYALAHDGLRVNIGPDRTTCLMIGVKPCNTPPSRSQSFTPSSALKRRGGVRSGTRQTPNGSAKRRRSRASTPKGKQRIQKFIAPPEMETESRHGRSTFQHANQGANQRYEAVRSRGYKREPRKDLSCCQMAMRYLWPADY